MELLKSMCFSGNRFSGSLTRKGKVFYLDGLGHLLPLNPAFSARVIVATGFIDEPFAKKANYLQDTVRKKDSAEYRSV